MKYKNDSLDQGVSLHDCIVSDFSLDQKTMTLEIEDGVWITKENPNNPFDSICRTSKATVKINVGRFEELNSADSDCVLELRKDIPILKHYLCKDYRLPEIENYIGQFEITYVYRNFNTLIITGWILSSNQFRIIIHDFESIEISYDNVEEKEWGKHNE